jgi:chorismate mutase
MKKEKEKLWLRGIRGAVNVDMNERSSILKATMQLLKKIVSENEVEVEEIVSVFLTTTKDINAEFPAYALREMGWKYVPVLCVQEIDVPGSLKRVIRVLVNAYVNKTQKEIKHQYLGKTINLRPDLKEEDNDYCNGI